MFVSLHFVFVSIMTDIQSYFVAGVRTLHSKGSMLSLPIDIMLMGRLSTIDLLIKIAYFVSN